MHWPRRLTLFAILICFITITSIGITHHANTQSELTGQSDFDKREAAYRANNIGVGLLEQYKVKDAVQSFTKALTIDPGLGIAHINLPIALYYLPDAEGAKREAEKVLQQNPNSPQLHYVLGLIARTENRLDDAINEFRQVLKIDPSDVGTLVNIGQLYVQQRKYTDAISAFRTALQSEPYNLTALYNLGLLLTRTGSKDEAKRLIQKFQQLQQSGAGTSIGTNYLEGGRYAEAIVSTGAETELVDRATPDVKFTESTNQFFSKPQKQNGVTKSAAAVVLFDYDGDGDLDLFDGANPARLFRNDNGKFVDVTESSGLSGGNEDYLAAVAGDYDNDGKPDLFVARASAIALYHNDGNGHFSDRTKDAGLPSSVKTPYVTAAFVDVDHDGDLDIFLAGATNTLFRNNANGTFSDITASAKLNALNSSGTQIVPTDYDNRRDIDLFLLNRDSAPKLYRNLRDGTFLDVAADAGLTKQGVFWFAAAGDINKDGFTDFFLGGNRDGTFFISDGRAHFTSRPGPAGSGNARAAQFLDYDNDGLFDLVAITDSGLHIWRNVGNEFVEVSARAIASPNDAQHLLASGDLDSDGDEDLVYRDSRGALHVLRNEGGNRNHSLTTTLHGRISNNSGIGAKVELRAGSLWQKLETYSASPAPAPADIVFGLGKREMPDALRVLWPAGIVQAETEFPQMAGKTARLNVLELDRKPSSCPYLYTWNGERFEFITDFMGGGEMGYLEEPGRFNKPDPVEYVRITDNQLKEQNGRFEIRVTNELEEALFADRFQLLAITHPADCEVYPNEGMSDPPKPFKLFVTRGARPPLTAFDDHGNDVLDRVSRFDRRYPDDFKLARIRGYADEHTLTMKLAEPKESKRQRIVLLLTGWTDYAWSSDNVAATQAGKETKLPSLQVKDNTGHWRTVIEDIGIPVGRPQTVTVDLTGKFLSASREVRIVTSMRIYWDQILVDISPSAVPVEVTALDPSIADLHWRGFSREVTPDGREPFGYDYERVSLTSPWKTMRGHYTREGDVLSLLNKTDDMFVISMPGDEIRLAFDARRLPKLRAGYKRTFFLYADGFSKEMDINSASPDQVAPLPFHGMSRYPYNWPERYPLTTERSKYIEEYNTRVIRRAVPNIDLVAVR